MMSITHVVWQVQELIHRQVHSYLVPGATSSDERYSPENLQKARHVVYLPMQFRQSLCTLLSHAYRHLLATRFGACIICVIDIAFQRTG